MVVPAHESSSTPSSSSMRRRRVVTLARRSRSSIGRFYLVLRKTQQPLGVGALRPRGRGDLLPRLERIHEPIVVTSRGMDRVVLGPPLTRMAKAAGFKLL
jgi:hypothetical protein